MSGVLARIGRNWRALSSEQRLAAIAALALLLSMLLPWYRESETLVVKGQAEKVVTSLNAFAVYSFVEAAIFVVAVGVLVLMWTRAERRAFHLPGGDGTIVMGAGLWVMFLIFYRQFDRPDRSGINADVSVNWGIFIAFLLGALLAYAGYRIRAAHVPEPALEGEDGPPPGPKAGPARAAERRPTAGDADEPREATAPADAQAPPDEPAPPDEAATLIARRRRPPADDPFDRQLSFDEPAEYRPPPRS